MEKISLEQVELMIAKFLRYGVIAAGLVLLAGWASQINFHQDVYAQFHNYAHVSLVQALRDAMAEHNWGLITSYVGLIMLIALPFTRVALTAIVFLIDHDYIMASCAILVMLGLTFSICLGFQL